MSVAELSDTCKYRLMFQVTTDQCTDRKFTAAAPRFKLLNCFSVQVVAEMVCGSSMCFNLTLLLEVKPGVVV